MAFSFTDRWFIVLFLLFIFVSTCKFGRAYDYPQLGAAGVIANEYVPNAEVEGETGQFFPQAGIIGTSAPLIFSKALRCLSDKYKLETDYLELHRLQIFGSAWREDRICLYRNIYTSCEDPHRLTQSGELHVPPEFTDEYCKGPCVAETHHALDCMNKILKGFIFLNRATLNNVRDALESGCSYGPKRGDFNVVGHIQADDGSKRVPNGVVYALVATVVVWTMLV